ncbi:MAG: ferritin [Alphaproteobacteria bacterium]|nr:ferritin [Alphaproteobacteria bacterium]
MAQTAQYIVKDHLNKIIDLLNQAYAEEWLAYYQYWIGAQVAAGPMRPDITAEFLEHANEELKHAGWLANRIIELGGTPVLSPDEWSHIAKCRYEAPSDPCIYKILEQNLTAERCAVSHYQQLCEICHTTDYVTFRLAEKLLKEEVEHEQEIEDFIHDLEFATRCGPQSE